MEMDALMMIVDDVALVDGFEPLQFMVEPSSWLLNDCLISLMMEHMHLMMALGPCWRWHHDDDDSLVTWYIHIGDGLMSFGHDDIHDVTWCSCLWWGTLFPYSFIHLTYLALAPSILANPCKTLTHPSLLTTLPLNHSYILALYHILSFFTTLSLILA